MKRLLCVAGLILSGYCSNAQITITLADMPVSGDSLMYSNVSATGATVSTAETGPNMNWNYQLTPTSTGMDIYKTPGQVSPFLLATLPSADLYGYKVLDSIPFISMVASGVTISDIYTFFQKVTIPPCYVAAASSMTASGFPLGSNYTDPDVWYKFPLTYGNVDSNYYELNISLLTFGGLKEAGYRKNTVDGWGTITTPYYTTPVSCIRVRSEIFEIDSITFNGTTFSLPRNSVEYKWLVNGDHYPALWVTSSVLPGAGETITSIKYRDGKTTPDISAVASTTNNINTTITAYPNPSPDGIFTLGLPTGWQNFHVDVYDMQSRLVASQDNNTELNIQSLPAGTYLVRVLSGSKMAFVQVAK